MTPIPAGWKLVPIEPTAEMWAAVNKLDDEMAAGAYDGKGASIEQVWNCLVETAPESPPVTVALDPDPRGVSVGVWQGSRCIYSGAHALPASVASGDAQDEQAAQDGKRPDLDWISGVCVTDTVGSGWCVRIDGTDIFEDVNRFGCKGRRSFQIAKGLASKQLAQRAAVEWLTGQLSALAAPAAGDALDKARLDWLEQHDGRFFNKDRISSIVGVGFIVAGDLTGMRHQSVRAAIDAAIAQQKGEA